MFYLSGDIFATPAETILIPICITERVKKDSLHQKALQLFGEDYTEDLLLDMKKGALKIGLPSIYVPPSDKDLHHSVLNFPYRHRDNDTHMAEVICGFREMFSICKAWDIRSVAIPNIPTCPWDLIENIIVSMELLRGPQTDVELWMYPPEESDDDETVTDVTDAVLSAT